MAVVLLQVLVKPLLSCRYVCRASFLHTMQPRCSKSVRACSDACSRDALAQLPDCTYLRAWQGYLWVAVSHPALASGRWALRPALTAQVHTNSPCMRCPIAMSWALFRNTIYAASSPGKPAGYLYMTVGNGKRDLPSQNYGNTMLKLQPPMNPCACCCVLCLRVASCAWQLRNKSGGLAA